MTTFTRVCIADHIIIDCVGRELVLKKGEKYLTSEEKDGMVTVFTTYRAQVPATLFGYEVPFTK